MSLDCTIINISHLARLFRPTVGAIVRNSSDVYGFFKMLFSDEEYSRKWKRYQYCRLFVYQDYATNYVCNVINWLNLSCVWVRAWLWLSGRRLRGKGTWPTYDLTSRDYYTSTYSVFQCLLALLRPKARTGRRNHLMTDQRVGQSCSVTSTILSSCFSLRTCRRSSASQVCQVYARVHTSIERFRRRSGWESGQGVGLGDGPCLSMCMSSCWWMAGKCCGWWLSFSTCHTKTSAFCNL